MLGKELVNNQVIIEKVSIFDMLSISLNNHENQTIDETKEIPQFALFYDQSLGLAAS